MTGVLSLRIACCVAAAAFAAGATDLDGTILIKRKLTKPRVTPEAGLYQRGVAVGLDVPDREDPLAFERSHVAVYIEGSPRSAPRQEAVMEQKGRRFVPDLVVIPAGSTVSFPNLDPIFHNVFSLSKARSFDLGNYPRNQTRRVAFPEPGVVFLHCHLHPNMSAAIVVAPSRWCTRVSADGRFRLTGLPPGRYTVAAWHKSAGTIRQQVEVGSQRSIPVEFLIPLEEK